MAIKENTACVEKQCYMLCVNRDVWSSPAEGHYDLLTVLTTWQPLLHLPITGDVSPKVTDIKSDLLPSTWGWYSWQLHGDETKGNRALPCRATPVFKRILRMRTPNTKREGRGEGRGGVLILGLVVHPKSGGTGAKLHGPDVSSAHTSRQTPFTKLTTFMLRVLLRQMRVFTWQMTRDFLRFVFALCFGTHLIAHSDSINPFYPG